MENPSGLRAALLAEVERLRARLQEHGEAVEPLRWMTEELQRSEARFRAVFRNAAIGIALIDREGHTLEANPALLQMLGYSAEELRGISFSDFTHPEDLAVDLTYFDELLRGARDSYQLEKRFIRKDGTVFWGRISASIIRDAHGTIYPVGMLEDISERVAAEEALRESEERWRLLVEHHPEPIIIHVFGRIVYLNKAAAETLGATEPEEMIGRSLFDLIHPSHRERLATRMTAMLGGAPTSLIEYRGWRLDGEDRYVEALAVPITYQGQPALQSVMRDITTRKQMEEALHRYAERLVVLHKLDQAILNAQSPTSVAEAAGAYILTLIPADRVAVVVFDLEEDTMTVLAAHARGAQHLRAGMRRPLADYGPSEAFMQGEIRLVHDATAHEQVSPMDRILSQEGLRSRLGVPLVVQGQVIGALSLAAYAPDVFTAEYVDVAREVAVQLSLAIHSTRLFEAVQAARERLEKLSRQLVAVQEQERRYIALELHDEVGQVLTALALSLDVEDDTLPEAARGQLQKAREMVTLLTSKVRNLSLDLRPTMLDDLGLLPVLLWYIRRHTEQTGIKVTFRHNGIAGHRFRSDIETAAYRIVQEALTNVARHARVAQAAVRAWTNSGSLYVEVEDAGAGFDPQQVLDAPETAGIPGMHERMRLLGGTLTLESVPGAGTRLLAALPAHPAAEA